MPERSSVFSVARRSSLLWFSGFFLLIGTLFLVTGSRDAIQEQHFQTAGYVTDAVVLTKSIKRAERGENSSAKYEVRYRFRAADGRVVEGSEVVSVEEWERLEEGSGLRVRYLPQVPESNRLEDKSELGSAIVSAIFGGIFASISGFLFLRSVRRVWREVHLRRNGTIAVGSVLEVAPTNVSINKVRQWKLRYHYQDYLGRTHEAESGLLSPDEADAWKSGDTGTVRYDRRQPQASVWVGDERQVGDERDRARSRASKGKPGVFKRALQWVGMLAIIFLAVAVGEAFPPFKELERFLDEYQFPFLAATIGMTTLGFVLLIGGILSLVMAQGEPMSHEEVKDLHRSNRDLAAAPYVWRASTYRIWGKAQGVQASDAFSIRAMKEAWRTGAWRRDAHWRRRRITTAGALMLVCGGFSLVFVVGPAWIKLLMVGAMLYALARLTWGAWHA